MVLDGKRIFVIEDDHLNLSVINNLLRQNGAVVHIDLWGKSTPQKIKTWMPIDVILMDLMLPNNVSGFDVAQSIREIPELAAIPIIIVTAADPDVEMVKARKLGLNGFLSKPIDYETFAKSVAAVINGREVWGVLV